MPYVPDEVRKEDKARIAAPSQIRIFRPGRHWSCRWTDPNRFGRRSLERRL